MLGGLEARHGVAWPLVAGIQAVSSGRLDIPLVPAWSTTEVGLLSQDLNQMIAMVRRLLGDLVAMSTAHEAGELDAALEAESFAGAYRDLANRLNAMVASQVGLLRSAIGAVAGYAR